MDDRDLPVIASLRRLKWSWMLLAILAAALVVRFTTIGFGLPALNDSDELMFEMGALRMLRGPTLNPGWFGHPATTTMYLLAVIDAVVFLFASASGRFATAKDFAVAVYLNPTWIILPGRIAMALIGVVTIWLTAKLAKRFFGPGAGLVAAVLLAIDPVHITWSQVIRSDLTACLFMLLCLNASANIAERGRPRDYAMAAVWLGLAIATKWPFALTAIAIAAGSWYSARWGIVPRGVAMKRLAWCGLETVACLFVASPYLLLDHATVYRNLLGEGQVNHLGATGGDFFHNLWWYFSGPLYAGFGIIGLALVIVGAGQLRRHGQAFAILVPLAVTFLLLFGVQRLVWERWALPLLPIGAMIAGLGMIRLLEAVRDRGKPLLMAALLVGVVTPLAAGALRDGRERMTDTRQLATAWARANMPEDSSLFIEHFGFDILDRPHWFYRFPIGAPGCIDAIAMLRGRIPYSTIDKARGKRSIVDFGTVPAETRETCRTDFAIFTQYERYKHERALFPDEYAAYQGAIDQGRIAARFDPVPGRIGGPVVVVVDRRR